MAKSLLVVIDVQKEYITPGRPYSIRSIAASLEKAKAVLNFARTKAWTVIHIQHLQEGDVFGIGNPLADFVDGFTPKSGETIIQKQNYSSFSSSDFAQAVSGDFEKRVVIGYGSTKCCLATLMDGYSRDQKWTFVADASNARAEDELTEAQLHQSATQILKSFARVTTADALIAGN